LEKEIGLTMTAHIKTRKDLREFVSYEKQLYGEKHASIGFTPVYSEHAMIWRFISLLRYEEYHINAKHRISALWYKYRRVKLGRRIGFNIGPNTIDKGFLMYHVGSVLINAENIGQNFSCNINCALIAGGHDSGHPVIGNNVIIGYGSVICGNISIADGVAVGVCSFVNKSVLEPNICVAGSPAKKISNNGSATWGGMKAFEKINK
jgi:serine O-acetyltransferase